MHARELFHRFVLVAGVVATTILSADDARAAGKNIVLVVADDLSPTLGCYGDPAAKTPHLDALAADATRFTHAFCTTASCSASRSVILTGLFNHANAHYGHEHSYHHFRAYDETRSLPALLSAAGYRTGRIGKLHVGPPEVFRFDEVFEANPRNPVKMAEAVKGFVSASGSSNAGSAGSDRPFFLYFCGADPHRDGKTADELPGKPNRFGNSPDGFPGVETVEYDPAKVVVPPFLPDTPVTRAELAQYYQSVSRFDAGVGRLIAILKEAGVYDETLIVVTGDHGMAFPGAKTTVYEGGLRVPLIVRDPTQEKRGVVSEALVSFVDLTPTLLDFAGALDAQTGSVRREVLDALRPLDVEPVAGRRTIREPQVKFHGRSFLPTLANENPAGWDEVYASHTFHEITMYYPMRVVRTRTHKLIWNLAHPLPFPFASDLWEAPTWQDALARGDDAPYGRTTVKGYVQRPKYELYDVAADPNETKNLAADPAHAKTLATLVEKLHEFQKRTADPWELKQRYE